MASAQAQRAVDKMEDAIESIWPNIRKALVPIKNDSDLTKRTEMLDAMLDKIGEDEGHPLAFICDSVGKLIEEYERKNHAIQESSPLEVLKFLMVENSVKQKQLTHIIPQANLSAVLSGKRGLTLLQVGKISVFFRVSPALFIPSEE
jgi:HTH-type transcriptional regulator/antitoxin HigA